MSRFAKNAWVAFGRIFDFAPERTKAGQKITEMRNTLSRRGELAAIGADVQKVLGYTKSRNKAQWLIQKTLYWPRKCGAFHTNTHSKTSISGNTLVN